MSHSRFDAIADTCVAASLLGVAGFVDTIAFRVLNGSFVSFMSGNTTTMANSVATGAWSVFGLTAGLIVSFFGGAVCGAVITRCTGARSPLWIMVTVTAVMTVGTVVTAFTQSPPTMMVIAFATGVINSALSATSSVRGGLTYVTGTLVKSAQQLVSEWGRPSSRAWLGTIWMWLVFVTGAIAGGFGYRAFGISALWIGVGLVLVPLAIRVIEVRSSRSTTNNRPG